ncbi:Arginine/agmatine antiporter [Holospora curviuscula]|uniref:Arginine/agmatine antiporter n=2 Tax=Holospora curviuscula TaxID=1082868 RepID=A0A2S5R8T5_9PROT|nr:Arginine/agmatine antiporter [Holospora curviuscula]
MSPLAVVALVIGLQLGSALFLLPSELAPYGSLSALSWCLSGLGALSLSFIFIALSKCDKALGGPSVYVEKAFGLRAGFYVAWTYWVISWISAIPYLLLSVKALDQILPWPLSLLQEMMLIGVILSSITHLNLKGAVIAGRGEIVFTLLKIIPWICIPVILMLEYGFPKWVLPSAISTPLGLNKAMVITFWGFVGFEATTTITHCLRHPARVLPWALVLGTLCVICIYFFNTWVLMGVMPLKALMQDPNPYGTLFEKMWGPGGRILCALLATITCIGTLNSWILTCGQVISVAAKSNVLPQCFGSQSKIVHKNFGVWLTFYVMLITTWVIQALNFEKTLALLVEFCCAVFIGVYFVCLVSLLWLVSKKRIRLAFWMWPVCGISFLFCVGSLWDISGILWLGAGVIVASAWLMEFVSTLILPYKLFSIFPLKEKKISGSPVGKDRDLG